MRVFWVVAPFNTPSSSEARDSRLRIAPPHTPSRSLPALAPVPLPASTPHCALLACREERKTLSET
eukprot:463579-Rhodomonas_salina.1